jgi:hypothetical protein
MIATEMQMNPIAIATALHIIYTHERLFFVLRGGNFWEGWVVKLKFYPAGFAVDPMFGGLEMTDMLVLIEQPIE